MIIFGLEVVLSWNRLHVCLVYDWSAFRLERNAFQEQALYIEVIRPLYMCNVMMVSSL